MIIDGHTHIDFSSEGAGASEHLAAAEPVDICIVLPSSDGENETVNKKLSEYVGSHPDKVIGFAVLDPTRNGISVRYLKSVTEKIGLKGVVLYCSACGFHPAHTMAMQFYESAQELGLPVFFHNSGHLDMGAVLDYAQPFLLDEVARTFPSLKMIIGTMGMPFVEQTFSMISKHQNVYADLSIKPTNLWQIYNIVLSAYERGLMDKLLFGSGFPLGDAASCIESLLSFNRFFSNTDLPDVPLGSIRGIIERDTLSLLGISR